MSRVVPDPAPWIEGLPQERRGFFVSAESAWVDGEPVLSKTSPNRRVALVMRRACAVCGFEMPRDRPVYRAFAQGDAAVIRMDQQELANDPDGPMHLSCVLYSAMVCPYLREKTARLSSSSVNPGGRRGSRAAIMGFEDFGLMVYSRPHHFLDESYPLPHVAYLGLMDDIPYQDGAELAERYEAAVASDAAVIDCSVPRSFWTGNAADRRELQRALKADEQTIARATPVSETLLDGRPYAIFRF